MDDRQPAPLRNPSRTLAMVAVAVLIVIAIAGLVVAGLRARGPVSGPAGSESTQQGAPPLTGAAPASAPAEEAGAGPNQIVFAPTSDQLSEPAEEKLVRLARAAKKENRVLSIASKVEAGPDRTAKMELARKRSDVVRQLLQSNGVPLGRMRIEISELPLGVVSAAEANRVDVVLQ
jgi:outer membrane protein OmpA-like peptidoglycan-associated protein